MASNDELESLKKSLFCIPFTEGAVGGSFSASGVNMPLKTYYTDKPFLATQMLTIKMSIFINFSNKAAVFLIPGPKEAKNPFLTSFKRGGLDRIHGLSFF